MAKPGVQLFYWPENAIYWPDVHAQCDMCRDTNFQGFDVIRAWVKIGGSEITLPAFLGTHLVKYFKKQHLKSHKANFIQHL